MAVIGGIYDPAGAFDNSTDLGIDSLYVLDWNKPLSDIGNGMSLTAACALSASRSRTPLVTIQPVANPKITKNPANTLSHIAAGLYDANTRAIAASMNAYGGPAYLRWGPEMDDPVISGAMNGRYRRSKPRITPPLTAAARIFTAFIPIISPDSLSSGRPRRRLFITSIFPVTPTSITWGERFLAGAYIRGRAPPPLTINSPSFIPSIAPTASRSC
jgi:hypothetical protein